MARAGQGRPGIVRIAFAAILIGLIAPAGASAAVTPLQRNGGAISYTPDNGEVNKITISRVGDQYVFTDTGAGFVMADVAASCMFIGAMEARCSAVGTTTLNIGGGDLNDIITVDPSVVPPLQTFSLAGGTGDDELNGGPGISTSFNGDAGVDTMTGADRADSFSGGAGNDVIFGRGGNDQLRGQGDNDVMDGGEGFDNFDQGSAPDGADTMIGGPDIDALAYSQRDNSVVVTANDVADDGESGEGDNVGSDVENFNLGDGNDTVMGGPGPNQIQTGFGNDDVSAGGGNDFISGSNGDDVLRGEGGDDQISADNGTDSVDGGDGYDYINEGFFDLQVDTLNGGPGLDSLGDGSEIPIAVSLDGLPNDGLINPPEPAAMDNVMPDVENVVGTELDDILIGNDSDNELTGGGGNDTLIGLGGADGLFGGNGADSLSGGPGIDTLSGAGGADTLRSRDEGPDEIDCGSSVDTLFADSFDDPSADCDAVSRGVRIAFKRASLSNGKVSLTASCPAIEPGGCAASFTLRAGGKVIARANKVLDPGENAKVKLKPTKAGRKALDGNGSLGATATATMTDSAGDVVSSERKLRVQL